MVVAVNKILGKGVYTPAEAAFYARIPVQTMSRWVLGSSRGQPIVNRVFDPDDKNVSFLEFVQALSVRAIKNTYRIPLPRIREAVTEAEKRWGMSYPFAALHRTFLFGDLKNAPHKAQVIIRPPGNNEDLVQVTGKARGNKIIAEVAELHMDDLTLDKDGLAAAYKAWERNGRAIVLDPKRQFGEPLVAKSGYSASALWHAYVTEGGIENAAKAYAVDPEDVALAIEYFDHLRSASELRDKEA